jgi:hypothetical protein
MKTGASMTFDNSGHFDDSGRLNDAKRFGKWFGQYGHRGHHSFLQRGFSALVFCACLPCPSLWAQSDGMTGVGVPAPVPLIDTRIPTTVTDTLKAQVAAQKKAQAQKEAAKKAAADALKKAQEAKKAAKLAKARKLTAKKSEPEPKATRLHTSAGSVEFAKQTPLIAPENLSALSPTAISPDDHIELRPLAIEGAMPTTSTPETPATPVTSATETPETKTSENVSIDPALPSDEPESRFDRAMNTMKSNVKKGAKQVKTEAGALFNTVVPEPFLRPKYQTGQSETGMKPVSYSPLPGIAIFAVQRHGTDKAFSDLPVLFAQQYASRLALRVPDTHIYNPLYTVESLRLRGLGHVYDKMMAYYMKAGEPEPAATQYLLQQITQDNKTISRLVFVEAELETGRPDRATGPMERLNALLTDGTPKSMKAMVHSRLQIFDVEHPAMPMVWSGSWDRAVAFDRFRNVTQSVYDDSDSEQTFATVSREMSRELLYVMPKTAYMVPVYDTSVQGKLATPGNDTTPNAAPQLETAAPLSSASPLNPENKQAIERILKRQNATSP